jgi:hypothetical protein
MQQNNLYIRASEIKSILNCSRQYAHTVLNSLNPVTLSITEKNPPKACLRADFERWLEQLTAKKTNAVGDSTNGN